MVIQSGFLPKIGKAGSDVAAFTEAIARMVSIALRSGIDPQEIADQLMGIGGSRSIDLDLIGFARFPMQLDSL